MSAPLECQDAHRGRCCGPVALRERPTDWKAFPRCDHHAEDWYAELERIQRAYGSPTPPADFDSAYAGERWDEDY